MTSTTPLLTPSTLSEMRASTRWALAKMILLAGFVLGLGVCADLRPDIQVDLVVGAVVAVVVLFVVSLDACTNELGRELPLPDAQLLKMLDWGRESPEVGCFLLAVRDMNRPFCADDFVKAREIRRVTSVNRAAAAFDRHVATLRAGEV